MDCPLDDTTLVISSRDGIEIDYCPQCRGVWLDRGELDKIIERAAPTAAPVRERSDAPPPRYDAPPPRYDDRRYEDRDRDRDDDRYRYDKRRKKRSFLEEIFDFD